MREVQARRKFQKFKPEGPVATREPKVENNPDPENLEKLRQAFNKMRWRGYSPETPSFSYDDAVALIKGISYSRKEVEAFTVVLPEPEEHNTDDSHIFQHQVGVFLSALINCGQDDCYRIDTSFMDLPPSFLGSRNTKKVIVKGSTGIGPGYQMESGMLVIEGDCGTSAGRWMTGGKILVMGNAGGILGFCMESGVIHVHGNAGSDIGNCMKGGIIKVDGNAGPDAGRGLLGNAKIFIGKNAGPDAGSSMKSGRLVIHGDALGAVGNHMEGGLIYVGGDMHGFLSCGKGGLIILKGNTPHLAHLEEADPPYGRIFHKGKILTQKKY